MSLFKYLGRYLSRQSADNSVIVDSTIIQAGGDVHISGSDTAQTLASLSDRKLLNKVMAEKANHYSDLLLHLKFDELAQELDAVFNYGIDNLEKELATRLYFFRFCQGLMNNNETQMCVCKDFLSGNYSSDAEWLANTWKVPSRIEISTFLNHLPETQAIAIDRLFKQHEYEMLIALCDKLSEQEINNAIRDTLSLYKALSFFNTDRVAEAKELLGRIEGEKLNVRLFRLITDLRLANEYYVDERNDEELKKLLSELDKLHEKASGLFEANAQAIGILTLMSYFNLGRNDRNYLQKAEIFYNTLSPELQGAGLVHYYGLCLEMLGKLDVAITTYLSCDWQHDEVIAARLMLSYIQKQDYATCASLYEQIAQSTSRTVGLYLFSLYLKGDKNYRDKLREAAEQYSDSYDKFFLIAFYVENEKCFKEIIVPTIKNMREKGIIIDGLEMTIISGYVFLFSHFDELALLKIMIDQIDDLKVLSKSMAHEVYGCLCHRIGKYSRNDRRDFYVPEEVKTVDNIAQRFINADIYKEWFLQIKFLVAQAEGKRLSMLKFSKEIYDLTKEPLYVANILGIELELGKSDLASFEQYLEVAKQFTNPHHLLTAAIVYQRLGNREQADFYAYRALRALNGSDDFDVYGRFFLYASKYFGEGEVETNKNRASGKSIVFLESEGNSRAICLDGEPEFTDEGNRCFEIDHMCRSNLAFQKLASCSKGQVLNIEGTIYKVSGFIPRSVYAVQYVIKKIQEYPERFKQYVRMISTSNPEDMLEQIRALTNDTYEQEKLHNLYNFSDSEIGIPIEFFVNGNYERYIQALTHLLFTQDQAYYSGSPVIEGKIDDAYVITISTLVLLAVEDWLWVLNPIKSRIVCPESYLEFFRKLYEKEIETQNVSVGELGFDDSGKAVMTQHGDVLSNILERIVRMCQELKTVPVTNDERINYEMLEGVTGEQFISDLRIDQIQVDALIVAEKQNATYMCDDLFFRKLASFKKIKNVNFTFLLYHYTNHSQIKDVVLGLSKTNYIYTPLLYETQEEAYELIQNLMNGKRKSQLYGEFLNFLLSYLKATYSQLIDYDATDQNYEFEGEKAMEG